MKGFIELCTYPFILLYVAYNAQTMGVFFFSFFGAIFYLIVVLIVLGIILSPVYFMLKTIRG